MKKGLVASIAFAAVALVAGTASADYVCNVSYYAGNSTIWGSEGSLYISIYTGKNCTGTFVKSYALCSANANSSSCAAGRPNDRQTLLANLQALQHAAAVDQKVFVVTATCNGGASGCGDRMTYYAE